MRGVRLPFSVAHDFGVSVIRGHEEQPSLLGHGSMEPAHALVHDAAGLHGSVEIARTRLVDLDIAVTDSMCRYMGVNARFHRASGLDIGGERSERLIRLCRHFSADRYLTGDAAGDYLDQDAFRHAGIAVEWQNYQHPRYPQRHGEFLSHLSALDLIFNVGPDSLSVVRQGNR